MSVTDYRCIDVNSHSQVVTQEYSRYLPHENSYECTENAKEDTGRCHVLELVCKEKVPKVLGAGNRIPRIFLQETQDKK